MTNAIGSSVFRAYSAGSYPTGQISPFALEVASDLGVSTDALYSKSWDEFLKPNAPKMDVVITVCDAAANEVCPIWPGSPVTAHWGFADPSNLEGDEQKRDGFKAVSLEIERRIMAVLTEMTMDSSREQLRYLFKKVLIHE